MALLIVHIPRRSTLQSESPTAVAGGREWAFVWSEEGLSAPREGVAALHALPAADRTVWVLDEADVTWLSADLPKGPSHRLPELLAGLLEDQVVGDVADTHFAVASPTGSGTQQWIAAVQRSWLRKLLDLWRAAGREVDAVVCGAEPTSVLRCHRRMHPEGNPEVVVTGPTGVLVADLRGTWWRTLDTSQALWTTEPEAAGLAVDSGPRLAGLLHRRERLVQAATQGTNLLQFDLAARNRSIRWMHAAGDAWTQPQARWLRRGAVVLLALQCIGLGASLWHQEQTIQALESRGAALLRSTFPQVTLVLDAARQMQREVEALETRAGIPPATDLEAWLDIVAAHWPAGHPPLQRAQADGAQVRLEAEAWPENALQALTAHAKAQGWTARLSGNQWSAEPSRAGGRP